MGDYSGFEVENSLKIMKMLNDGKTLEEIREQILDDGHSGRTFFNTMGIILLYAKRGPELFKFMNRENLDSDDKKYVKKIEELNKKLDSGYKYDEAEGSLSDHAIMDILISTDFNEAYDNNVQSLKKNQEGTILVNDDLTFEDIIGNDEYVTGKILEEGGISIATFHNDKMSSHYCGLKQDDRIVSRHEFYSIDDGIIDCGFSAVEVYNSNKNFSDEIQLKSKIRNVKKRFNEDTRNIYKWYKNNIDSEIQRTIFGVEDDLRKRLVSSLINRMAIVEEQGPVLEKNRK